MVLFPGRRFCFRGRCGSSASLDFCSLPFRFEPLRFLFRSPVLIRLGRTPRVLPVGSPVVFPVFFLPHWGRAFAGRSRGCRGRCARGGCPRAARRSSTRTDPVRAGVLGCFAVFCRVLARRFSRGTGIDEIELLSVSATEPTRFVARHFFESRTVVGLDFFFQQEEDVLHEDVRLRQYVLHDDLPARLRL